MPTFNKYVDVDPEEFLEKCTDENVRELVELIKSEYSGFLGINEQRNRWSIGEQEFESCLYALHGKWNMLTSEEEQIVKSIAKRFV